jgi:hypothetical protein
MARSVSVDRFNLPIQQLLPAGTIFHTGLQGEVDVVHDATLSAGRYCNVS